MSPYPKELIFKDRKNIDEFLDEPGLNSSLYDLILLLKEPDLTRYALKVPVVSIFNEAYGQALRVILDNHPEEDYYNNYFLNAKKYFTRSYEAELVFSIVYVLLKLTHSDKPNVKRFTAVLEQKMSDKPAYFPHFVKYIEDHYEDPFYDPNDLTFNLHTDEISIEDLAEIKWDLATYNYKMETIQSYLSYAPSLEYQIAMLDSIYNYFQDNLHFFDFEDIKTMIDSLKESYKKYARKFRALPVFNPEPQKNTPTPVTTAGTPPPSDYSQYTEEICRLKSQIELLENNISDLQNENQELKEKKSIEETEERTLKVKDLSNLAKSLTGTNRSTVFSFLRLAISDVDKNWIERLNAEEGLIDTGSNDKICIAKGRNTDLIKIISVMFDLRFFRTKDDLYATNKQEIMNKFGEIIDINMANYSVLLSTAKGNDNFLDIFDKLKETATKYKNGQL